MVGNPCCRIYRGLASAGFSCWLALSNKSTYPTPTGGPMLQRAVL
uniref:Uncharacterized protein n=1 Tax=Setaria italica TaxID=4555 RepID=K3ZGL6_SETIT